jgi:GNAT superfamily N-acetyltransferase
VIQLSDVEGRRFGLKAGRIEAERIHADALLREVLEGGWDWLVLRLPTGQEDELDRLRALGLEPQQTDTLMTWSADLRRVVLPAEPPSIELRPADARDAPAIEALVRSVFARYPNHYTANPLLDRERALEGYVEWALGHVQHPARLCWLALVDGEIAGLSCSRHDPGQGVCAGVLHGVDERFGGRGVYRGMIEASLQHYRDAGYREFRISTQAGNHTVQNLWARLGLRLVLSQSTLHLMPLLGLALRADPQRFAADDPLQRFRALHDSAIRHDTQRSSLYLAPQRDLSDAAQVRSACWPGRDGRQRHVSVLCDAAGRPLAWLHSDAGPATSPIRS